MKQLSLKSCSIGPAGMKALANAMLGPPTPTGNQYTPPATAATQVQPSRLASTAAVLATAPAPSAAAVAAAGGDPPKHLSLEVLELSGNALGGIGLQHVNAALRQANKLQVGWVHQTRPLLLYSCIYTRQVLSMKLTCRVSLY